MTHIDAMKYWLNAMETELAVDFMDAVAVGEAAENLCGAIASLRQAIAEAEKQEPDKYVMEIECTKCGAKQSGVLTVHTHPQPKHEPLTDEQIEAIWGNTPMMLNAHNNRTRINFARAIEAAHGIKGEA